MRADPHPDEILHEGLGFLSKREGSLADGGECGGGSPVPATMGGQAGIARAYGCQGPVDRQPVVWQLGPEKQNKQKSVKNGQLNALIQNSNDTNSRPEHHIQLSQRKQQKVLLNSYQHAKQMITKIPILKSVGLYKCYLPCTIRIAPSGRRNPWPGCWGVLTRALDTPRSQVQHSLLDSRWTRQKTLNLKKKWNVINDQYGLACLVFSRLQLQYHNYVNLQYGITERLSCRISERLLLERKVLTPWRCRYKNSGNENVCVHNH